jgi:hypothetical protein
MRGYGDQLFVAQARKRHDAPGASGQFRRAHILDNADRRSCGTVTAGPWIPRKSLPEVPLQQGAPHRAGRHGKASGQRYPPRTLGLVHFDGKNVFAVELLRDLVFGDKTRIYKVAIFIKAWSATGFVAGEAVDEQSDRNIAAYFLGKFLGMRLREEPSVMTEMLLDGITQAINRSTMTGDQKVEVQHALLSELRSNDKQFDPTAFIQKHVPNGQVPWSGVTVS